MYTHRITFTTRHATLGDLLHSFRTTADAVDLHLAALAHRRDVTMYCVETL